jgi:hypothetical protein
MDYGGSHRKVERAKKHIGDLVQALALFAKSDFYAISIDKSLCPEPSAQNRSSAHSGPAFVEEFFY